MMLRTAVLLVTALGLVWVSAETDREKYPGQPAAELALPPGWHAGGEVDLEITGGGLFDPKDLLFYQEGIEVVSIAEIHDRPMTSSERYQHKRKLQERARRNKVKLEGDIEYPRKEVRPGTRLRARLKISPRAQPGEYPFRVLARGGLGSVMTFWVGRMPTVVEKEHHDSVGANDQLQTAQAVEIGSTVNAFLARHDVDVFKVQAKAGQRLSFEVEGARLANYARGDYLDLQLAVQNAAGEQIAFADDSALFLEDPFVSFVAAADGEYFVSLEESVPTGSGKLLPYRLHVSAGIRPAMLYPAGGRPGEQLKVNAILLGEQDQERTLGLPKASGTLQVLADPEAPSGNPLRVFDAPNVLEAEPNNAPGQATASGTSAPVALNGIISKAGDVDVFRVRLKKDVRYTLRLYSSALGSPLDARLWIAPADKPNSRKRFEDCGDEELERVMTSSIRDQLDPAGVFVPGADGDYLVGVEDSRGAGGELCVYRVEIAEAKDSVISYLVPPRDNEPRRGNRVQVFPGSHFSAVIALRNGFGSEAEGEFELVAEGLPKGVTLHAPRFTSAETRLPVVFEAAPGAKPAGALVDLHVRRAGGGGTLPGGFRSTVPFNDVGGNNYLYFLFVEQLAVAVVDGNPFSLEVSPPKAALTQDGELAIKVRVKRQPGFEEPIEINAQWLPPNCARPSPITLAPGESEADYLLGARRNTPPDEYRIALTATSTNGDRRTGDQRYSSSTELLALRVAESYLSAKLPRVAIEIGKTAQLVAKLEHIKPFEGQASARLGRLPDGVELVGGPVPIKPGQETLTFTLRSTEAALTGTYRGVFCDLEFTENGQRVSQRSGYGTLRVDAKRGKRVVRTK